MTRALLATLLFASSLALAQEREPPGDRRHDQIRVTAEKQLWSLQWRDEEDALKGAILPLDLREGTPLKVSLRVGSFQGQQFEGPLTVSLRAEGESHGQSETVEPEEGTWLVTFVPRKAGPHTLDVSFRTTRYKLLHAELKVSPTRLPRSLAWAVAGFIALLALALGVFRVLKKQPTPREPPLTT